jgi:hypothetical protein
MATDTIEAPEQIVAKRDTTILFMSRRSGLRLTWASRYPLRDPVSGQPSGFTKGRYIGFRDGVFRCPAEGPVTLVDTLDGGEAEIEDATELVAWLGKHRLNGNKEEGFWRVDTLAPAPTREELQALMDAVQDFDEDRMQLILDQERAGWERADIIETAEKALARLREVRAQVAEQERDRLAEAERERQAQAQALAQAEERAKKAEAKAAAATRAKKPAEPAESTEE